MTTPRILALYAALALVCTTAGAQPGAVGGQWTRYGGDDGATKYAPLDQIHRDNVADLEIVWRRPAIDASILAARPGLEPRSYFNATPLMIDGVLYSPNGIGLVEAFDAATGETIWVEQPFGQGRDAYAGTSTRGAAWWSSAEDRRLLVQRGEYLIALDPATGTPIAGFGDNGRVHVSADLGPNLSYRWGGAPLVIGDIVVLGLSMSDTFEAREAPRGDVLAYKVCSGELAWRFHVIPQDGEHGTGTWQEDAWRYTGHSPVWSQFSADPALGLVYLPVTAPTNDMYGGHRPGDNLYSQSIVAVDATTGRRVWHFQTVHHGLWDYDPPAAPILLDITVDGREIAAVALLTKQAFTFVFDRATGAPVWPIVERPVPSSDVPGERAAATQPFPTKPPPFDLQGALEEQLIDFTPALRAEALEIFARYTTGPLYTPPSLRDDSPGGNPGTIQMPGSTGGANWGGGAFDPETQILYVPSSAAPFVADVEPGDAEATNLRYVKGRRQWVAGPRGLPLFKPPYGRITAIDMSAGEIVWQVANGNGPRDHPAIRALGLGALGNPGHPAPLVTKTLLFAGEGTDAMVTPGLVARMPDGMPLEIVPNYAEAWFRAFDKANGEVLAEIELPGGTSGAPITYMHAGRQYIVVAVDSRDGAAEWLALALPDHAADRSGLPMP